MVRNVIIPSGSWPLEMTAPYAAGYCGEPSVEAFLSKVRQRIYPGPRRARGEAPKWHRTLLYQAIARRHGLVVDQSIVQSEEDVAALL
jgi:hypothetical protein